MSTPDHATPEPITEAWLRGVGFKWEQAERCIAKHWILWMGEAASDRDAFSSEDLGVEVSHGGADRDWWFCWLRADYAGRYTRFLHVRHLRWQHELTTLIAALTGFPFDAENVMYGSYHRPETAKRLREDYAQRMEVQLAESWGHRVMRATGQDPDARDKVGP